MKKKSQLQSWFNKYFTSFRLKNILSSHRFYNFYNFTRFSNHYRDWYL